MMVFDLNIFHLAQVLGPDTTEIRKVDYGSCEIQQLLKVK
jgi:hypothetical protein